MYAIIVTGGKQYKVENGDVIYIEKLDVAEEETVTFDKVVAVGGEDGLKAGAPYVEGCTVTGKVLKTVRVRRLLSSPTSRRRVAHVSSVTDSRTPKYKSKLSTHKLSFNL